VRAMTDEGSPRDPDKVTTAQLAALWGVETSVIYNLVKNGKLEPFLRTPGGKLIFSYRDCKDRLGRLADDSVEAAKVDINDAEESK
jgi:hypothetical protein